MKISNNSTGLTGFINGITEADIQKMIKRYRRKYPRDKTKDFILRPYAVNQIIAERRNNK